MSAFRFPGREESHLLDSDYFDRLYELYEDEDLEEDWEDGWDDEDTEPGEE